MQSSAPPPPDHNTAACESGDAGKPSLAPFVSPIREAVEASLRHLLGLPESVALAWARRGDHLDWSVHVRVGEGAQPLELDLFEKTRPTWFSGTHFAASYRQRPGGHPIDDPELDRLLTGLWRRFQSADQLPSGGTISPPGGTIPDPAKLPSGGAWQDPAKLPSGGTIPDPAKLPSGGAWHAFRAALEQAQRFEGVEDRMLREVSPDEAIIRLGFRCNQRCDFCWQDRAWPEPPDAMYYQWLDELAAAACVRVTFSGGEPTIHPELLPLVRHARELGMDVTLQTNCIQMAREGFAEQLVEAGVSMLFVSYHSHIAEISDDMTRAVGTHRRTVLGIANALRAGLLVELNAVVEQRNHAHMGEYARDVVDRFASGPHRERLIGVHFSHPCAAYEPDSWQKNLVPLDAVRPHLVAAIDVLSVAEVRVTAVGTCGFPPCLLADAPDTLRRLARDEQSSGDVDGRVFPRKCDACAFRSHCLGVRSEYLERFGDGALAPFAEMPPPASEVSLPDLLLRARQPSRE